MTKFYTPIQESSAHIYVSALPFCPKQSILYQKCTTFFKKRISILDNSMPFWMASHIAISVKKVKHMAYQPHTHLVYIGCNNGIIHCCNSYNGHFYRPLTDDAGMVSGLVITQNNILYHSGTHFISAWNLTTKQQLRQPIIHTSSIFCLALTPDDRYLITGSSDHIVIWDISQELPQLIHTLNFTGIGSVEAFSISNDCQYLAAQLRFGSLLVWNLSTFSKIAETSSKPFGRPTACALAGSKHLLVGTLQGNLVVYSLFDLLPQKHVEVCFGIIKKIILVDETIIIGTKGGAIYLYHFPTLVKLCEPTLIMGADITNIVVSSDKHFLAVLSNNDAIEICDLQLIKKKSQKMSPISCIQATMNDSLLWIASGKDLQLIDTNTWKSKIILNHSSRVQNFAVSIDGKHIISNLGEAIVIWAQNCSTYVEVVQKKYESEIFTISCADAQYAYVVLYHCIVWRLDLVIYYTEREIVSNSGVMSCCTFSDKNELIALSDRNSVFVWDLPKEIMIQQFPLIRGIASSMAFVCQSKYIAIALGTRIQIREVQTGNNICEVDSFCTINCIKPMLDNPSVIAADLDFCISIWNIHTGSRTFGPYKCHTNKISAFHISALNKQITSGGRDGTLRIWNTEVRVSSSDVLLDQKHGYQRVHFLACGRGNLPGSNLYLTPSGWLIHEQQLILWIPPWYRQSLVSPQVLCIPLSAPNQSFKPDWSNFVYGTNWTELFKSL